MATTSFTASACLAALLCACVASAQGKFDIGVSGSSFGRDEGARYGGFSLGYRYDASLRFLLRGTSSGFHTFEGSSFSVRHGGKDLEAIGYWRDQGVGHGEIGLGFSAVDTPARDKPVGTFDFGWWTEDAQARRLRIGLRGIATSHSLAMFFLDGSTPVAGPQWSLVGSFGVTAWGFNTLSTLDGRPINETIEKIGLRFEPTDRLNFEADLTNQVGETTGFSMTPTLGNRFGLRLSAGFRF